MIGAMVSSIDVLSVYRLTKCVFALTLARALPAKYAGVKPK
jgi:hypothetical protein